MPESFVRKPRWEDHELNYMAQQYNTTIPIEDIATALGRSTTAVRLKLVREGIKPLSDIAKFAWSEAEEEQLINLLKTDTVVDIAYKLNRTYDSVFGKIYHMGLPVLHHCKVSNITKRIPLLTRQMYKTLYKAGFEHKDIVNILHLEQYPYSLFKRLQ